VLAAFVVVSVERDKRTRVRERGDYSRDLFWYDTISAAQRVIEWARDVWLRSERRRRKITAIEVVDLILAERKSQAKAANELNVRESAIRNRYNRALKVIDEAGTDDADIVLNCGGPCYNKNIEWIIDGWRNRLVKLSDPAGWQNQKVGLFQRPRPRERRLPAKPKRKISRPVVNIWHGSSKVQVREATTLLVDTYFTNGGTVERCRPDLNYYAQGYWCGAGRRVKAKNLAGGRCKSLLRKAKGGDGSTPGMTPACR
jgi:hypothetical protein